MVSQNLAGLLRLQIKGKKYFHLGLLEIIVIFFSADVPHVCDSGPERVQTGLSMRTTDLPQNGPRYQLLTKAEYDPLIRPLGLLGIAVAIAIRWHDEPQ
ncbi:hypothetical protein GCM10011507_18750 [Edaphobacter acidisoli]|uniref:Uncharacterized protein n=1 Tax=Edaphobacter acidisoli TaxID=2040573 RepID=A0A916W5H6_9BACT|nr:hypothetical protein [Edaphobacter acidisoli]GGA67463.1 hypothetical protein GCM10011507_18750 [Edaphobacter acidisoli]